MTNLVQFGTNRYLNYKIYDKPPKHCINKDKPKTMLLATKFKKMARMIVLM